MEDDNEATEVEQNDCSQCRNSASDHISGNYVCMINECDFEFDEEREDVNGIKICPECPNPTYVIERKKCFDCFGIEEDLDTEEAQYDGMDEEQYHGE